MSLPVDRTPARILSRVVYVSAGKLIDFRRGAVYPRCETRVRGFGPLGFDVHVPYDLARVGRAEPYLAHVAVVTEVVKLLRVRVFPAANTHRQRQKSVE